MDTLEALVAVMLVLGLVLAVMQAQASIAVKAGEAEEAVKTKYGGNASLDSAALALGKGRSSGGNENAGYARWFFA